MKTTTKKRNRYYVLIEWHGNGSGSICMQSHDKEYLLSLRTYTFTASEAIERYNNPKYLFKSDLPESEILTYKSINDYHKRKDPIDIEHWF